MEILMIGAVIGLIPAAIAKSKGYSFILWWIFGTFLFIVALPVALLMKPDTAAIEQSKLRKGMKKCPFCAELIKQEANVCKYCGREFAIRPKAVDALGNSIGPMPPDTISEPSEAPEKTGLAEDTFARLRNGEPLPPKFDEQGQLLQQDVVSRIEPINAPTQKQCEKGWDTPASDNATVSTVGPQARPKNLGLILAMAVLAFIGIIAGQAISSAGSRTKTTSDDVASQSRALTPSATPCNTVAETQRQGKPPVGIDANADLLKGFEEMQRGTQKIREEYKDRAVKIIAPLDARLKIGFLTDAQTDMLEKYKGEFERLYIDGMTQTTAVEQDVRHLRVAAMRLQRAGASAEDVKAAAQDGILTGKSIKTRMKLIYQLDDEWIETGKEYNRRLQEVGLQ